MTQKNPHRPLARPDGPGSLAAFRLEDLDHAEGLKNGDDELAHMDIVVHDKNLQPVETVSAHPSIQPAAAQRLGAVPGKATLTDVNDG